MEVDKVPKLKQWALLKDGLIDQVQRLYRQLHGRPISAFDDLFVVKYDATGGGQTELLTHVDGGECSFMVALSPRCGYAGGGTRFYPDSGGHCDVHLEEGDLVTFPAELRHQGLAISEGVRFLLVGFCFLHPSQASVGGNVGVDLCTIHTSSLSLSPSSSSSSTTSTKLSRNAKRHKSSAGKLVANTDSLERASDSVRADDMTVTVV